jgi:glyoxylase-like metal-dependent hydrolase (beta-lactamase superfamily II)
MEIERISLGFVNAYLMHTDTGLVLVDTGVPSSRGNLESALEKAGCKPGTLKLIIATHGDIDHSGNCAHLREKYGAQIAMHRGDSEMVETGAMNRRRKVRSLARKIRFMIMGLSGGYKRMLAQFRCFTPDVLLEDGQSLQEFGLDATVLHLPGHTPGSLGILTAGKDLIAGDTLANQGKPREAAIVADEDALKATMARLRGLEIATVYPGHGEPFAMRNLA